MDTRDHSGATARMLAKQCGHMRIVGLIDAHSPALPRNVYRSPGTCRGGAARSPASPHPPLTFGSTVPWRLRRAGLIGDRPLGAERQPPGRSRPAASRPGCLTPAVLDFAWDAHYHTRYFNFIESDSSVFIAFRYGPVTEELSVSWLSKNSLVFFWFLPGFVSDV